jgi:small subunit ribosomal protein S20
MRTSRNAKLENYRKRSRLRTAVKSVRSAGSSEEARRNLNRAISLLDKYSKQGILHPRNAARQKSQLTKYVRGMEQSQGT